VRSFIRVVSLIVIALLSGCWGLKPDTPPTPVTPAAPIGVTTLPPLVQPPNEVQISPNLIYEDPTWVLGALVDTETGEVFGLNSYLTSSAKPTVTQLSDVVLDDLLSQSIDLTGSYLSFLKADISSSSTDEVSVIKTSKAVISPSDVNVPAVTAFLNSLPADQRSHMALIAGYVDVTITASYLSDNGVVANASGFGAAIGGKWYAKSKNLTVQHCLIALVTTIAIATSPPPAARGHAPKTLVELTEEAIASGALNPSVLHVAHSLIPPK
jgi:hypothetical protein